MSLAVSTLSPSVRKRVLNQRERRQVRRDLNFQLESYRLSQEAQELQEDPSQSVVMVDDSWDYALTPELVDGKFTIDYDGGHSDEEDEFYYGYYDEADYYDGYWDPYGLHEYDPFRDGQMDPLIAS